MFTVAVTGNVASGKSALCGFLSELGAGVVSADKINQRLLRQSDFLAAWLAKIFPQNVVAADGRLDKAALRSQVFTHPELRERLEAVTHPLIRDNINLQRAVARKAPYLVLEIPLLFETATAYDDIDMIILITADHARLAKRIVARPGLNAEQADAILDTQLPDHAKFTCSDAIIINHGDLKELRQIATKIDKEIKQQARARHAAPLRS